jgi:benzoyl-CoA reductase/2-hydroxyglutaryl-CoA dehydratase subunit BcrC/BadD/HgdB
MNKPKIGWFCTYTPVEIIEAAGLEPYGVRVNSGKAHEDVYLGDAMCSYVRSCLGGALSGDYDFLDGVVIAHSCECMRRFYDGWMFKQEDIKPDCLHFLDVPRIYTEKSIDFFAAEIERLKEKLEERYGEISPGALSEAVARSAYTSKLLSQLNESRKSDAPFVTGAQIQKLMIQSMTTPRDQFNSELEAILGNKTAVTDHSRKPRIMVYGGPASSSLIDAIEDSGGIVVLEHMCNGLRQIKADFGQDENPCKYLARSYLAKPPCPRMVGEHSIFGMSQIQKMVSEYRVAGIIFFSIKFCANSQAFWPMFKDTLAGDVPVKMLEGDVSPDVNVREVQSFVKKLARRTERYVTGTEG